MSYISAVVLALHCVEARGYSMIRLLSFAALAVLACSAVKAHGADPSIRPQAPAAERRFVATPVSAPEFHPAAAVAALTLLLGGVAVLKGWRHE